MHTYDLGKHMSDDRVNRGNGEARVPRLQLTPNEAIMMHLQWGNRVVPNTSLTVASGKVT